ncbi:bifunctional diguanylate cyclase/phosphodiesterase [Massilia scottii]|uniref:bifunctional diguanylate cyclase/phosphodiesterase n=1 Tax=Massilia scottii TaxID=3057166 RepID=UPI0027969768|nr:EAL domain-containing protein [Massilia sp. CCM 9029]MDQ1833802.1 EAL domain-containing protein [Massilia sp. CCM 9029]
MSERFLASALPQHEAAELYRLMVVGIRDVAVFLMDPHGYITVWNRGAQDMKGYTADDAIGSHLSLLYTEQDRERGWPRHNLAKAAEMGFYSEETWRKRKDGSLFWAHVALTALRGDDGQLLGFSKITMDLTHHRLLEQCEKEKQEIDLILRAAQAGTWKWKVDSGQVEVSRHLLELLGYKGGARELDFDACLEFVHPDDRARFRALLEHTQLDPCLAPIETELRFLRHDGACPWFFLRANWHRGIDDGPMQFLGACVDIDNLKLAEEEKERLLTQLRQERARFADILEQMPSGIVLADVPSGRLTYQNRAAAGMMGRDFSGIDSFHDYDNYAFVDASGARIRAEDLPLTRAVTGQDSPRIQDLVYEREDGERLHLDVTTAAIVDSDGVARVAIAVLHDVSKLKHMELAAAAEKERALVTLAAITDGVITADRGGVIMSVNPAAERMIGIAEPAARGLRFRDVLQIEEVAASDATFAAIERCLGEHLTTDTLPHATLISREGQRFAVENAVAPVILDDGELIGTVLIIHDVTESKRLLRRLGFEASHDALTGLVNRREFELRLERAIERAQHPGGASAALLYMDLDQFKVVNDTCGHQAGDDLLKRLATTYSEHVRERDTLARIGGDEFALIVEHCDVDEAMAVAQKILDATRTFRYVCKGRVFQLGVSIGLTPIDAGTINVEEAMRRADHACYLAKDRGRNRIYVHYKGDLDFAQRRSDMHWVTRLTHAFQNDQLQLYYQPILPLDDGDTPRHYEILLRMRNGRNGPIGPAVFLPAAERYDVIVKIDRWVLTRTMEWLASNPEHMAALETCSINLSRRSLGDPSFHKFAADLIDASDVPAEKLCFEITENGAIADMQKTITFIEAFAARGCRFSLDDFGTGMTSFSYLKQLPVNYIKIDGSFIQMMSSSQVDFEMVRFTNDISHMMGRKTIAEYVTDSSILASLKAIGVDFAQGYWVGKPRPLTP